MIGKNKDKDPKIFVEQTSSKAGSKDPNDEYNNRSTAKNTFQPLHSDLYGT